MRRDRDFSRNPLGWFDQQRFLLPFAEREVVCADFHDRVRSVVTNSGIAIIQSDFRAKSDESIAAKLYRRSSWHYDWPMPDVYGARFILRDEEVRAAITAVVDIYPEEHRFPYSLPRIRDLTDPNTPRTRFSDPVYQAIHVYVAFGEIEVPNIGEVKLMTPEQLDMDIRTRTDYEEKTFKNKL